MPNAAGQAATRGRAKKATSTPATGAAEKKERHVRSPLERAQAAQEKTKARLDKAKAKLADFESAKAALAADVQEAQAEYDYANMHPLLVKARRDAAAAETSDRDDDYTPAAVDADAAADDAGEPAFADGSEIVSSVPAGEGEEGDEESEGDAESTSSAPPFDFAAALGSGQDPFAQPGGPQTTSV